VSRKWRNWYQNEVDEETEGVDSRDKVKHSDQLFIDRMMTVAEQEQRMMGEYLDHAVDGESFVGAVDADQCTAVCTTLAGRGHPRAVTVDEVVREQPVAVSTGIRPARAHCTMFTAGHRRLQHPTADQDDVAVGLSTCVNFG